MTFRPNHVVLGNGAESVILRRLPRAMRVARTIGILIVFVIVASVLFSILTPTPNRDVQRRIDELAAVQNSLRELDKYVSGQRSTLNQLSTDIERLEQERTTLSTATELNRKQVEALLEFQASEQKKQQWLSITFSFALGVISSMAASLLLRWFSRRTNSESF